MPLMSEAMAAKDGRIWLDGRLVEWREANIHILSHGLHYGTGIFEGVRCYDSGMGPAIFRLREHTARFLQSAGILGMKMPFSAEELMAAQCEVVRDNKLKSCYIRPLAFYGANSLGLGAADNPTRVCVAAWQWGTYLGEEGLQNGIRVKTSSFCRHHVNAVMCLAKISGHYVNSVMAHDEAVRDGYDEALLLGADGLVAEGAGENLFIVRGGKLYTPDMTSQLEGITRASVIALAEDIGVPTIERRMTRDAIYTADEAFFTGTAAEVTPIRELDGKVIGNGKRGELTGKLQKAFFEVVAGRGKRAKEWLTPV